MLVRRVISLSALLASFAGPSALTAQVEVRVSTAGLSGYVWRGLTLTNSPVLQPAATVVLTRGRAVFSFGGWANLEPARYNSADAVSQGGGAKAFDITEIDYTAEAAFVTGSVSWAVGSIVYRFPNEASESPSFNPAINTVEMYGRIGFTAPLSPTIAAYYDVSKVQGGYVEASVSQTVTLGGRSVSLSALGAWSAGQSGDYDASGVPRAAVFNFQRDGLTQVDVAASTSINVAGLSVSPNLHVVYAADPFVRVTAPGRERTVKLWFGANIGWAKRFVRSTSVAVNTPADSETSMDKEPRPNP